MLARLFYQAEDGIRDLIVTGVQTCALPIQAEDGIRDLIRYVRASFLYLVGDFRGNPPRGKMGGGPSGRYDLEAGAVKFLGRRTYSRLIFVPYAEDRKSVV